MTYALFNSFFQSHIKKYRNLMDSHIQIESPNLLKVHIVLLILQIIEKALSVQQISSQHNRLEALMGSTILLEGLNLSDIHSKELM